MQTEERSAMRLGPGEGRALWVLGELVTYKVTAGQTGGAYSLFEVGVGPGGGPPPHVERHEDECFYVLEGEFEFLDGGRTTRAGAGSLIYVPRGTLHAYKNVGNGVGRMLVSHTLGGLHERFFEDLGEPATNGSAPPASVVPLNERIEAVAAKYGIEIAPPPA